MKKYIRIVSDPESKEEWVKLAKCKGLPLATYIKFLLNREVEKYNEIQERVQERIQERILNSQKV